MRVLPIFLSSPCLVVGMPVVLAIVLLRTSTLNALLGENDVPGMLNIFMAFIVGYILYVGWSENVIITLWNIFKGRNWNRIRF